MALAESLGGVVAETHPRAALVRMLEFFIAQYDAKGAALFAAQGDDAILDGARQMRSGAMVKAIERWGLLLERLRKDEVVAEDGFMMAPLWSHTGDVVRLVGALYLDEPTKFQPEGFSAYRLQMGRTFHKALSTQGPNSWGVRFDEKRVLELALEEQGWNISRVARALGITRRTVYLRMEAFRIARKRVPKVFSR